ncbi:MAG: aldo/keto reductase [Thermoplasmata archaeon]
MTAASTPSAFDLQKGLGSTVRLHDGNLMPVFGLGVYQSPPGSTTREAVESALQVGYRLIDTAALYRNEKDVGEAIRASGIDRSEVFLTTKLWNADQGYDSALAAFEQSRRALGVEAVDLYLIHWPVTGKRSESWRALRKIQEMGGARSIGVSNYAIPHLEELLAESDVVPAVNQVEFSPFLFQSELLQFCQKRGIQIEAYAPLTRGKRLEDPRVTRIAKAHGTTSAAVLIRWGLQHSVVEIPKSVRPERIRDNAGAFTFSLTEEEMSMLNGLNEGLRVSWDPSEMR